MDWVWVAAWWEIHAVRRSINAQKKKKEEAIIRGNGWAQSWLESSYYYTDYTWRRYSSCFCNLLLHIIFSDLMHVAPQTQVLCRGLPPWSLFCTDPGGSQPTYVSMRWFSIETSNRPVNRSRLSLNSYVTVHIGLMDDYRAGPRNRSVEQKPARYIFSLNWSETCLKTSPEPYNWPGLSRNRSEQIRTAKG